MKVQRAMRDLSRRTRGDGRLTRRSVNAIEADAWFVVLLARRTALSSGLRRDIFVSRERG